MSEDGLEPSDKMPKNEPHPDSPGGLMSRRPVLFMLGFEGALAVLALLLALVFGLKPWLSMNFSVGALGQSVAATVPMVVAALALMRLRWDWVQALKHVVEDLLLPLFSHAGPSAVFVVALAAGIGEELLFRGVIQAGLEGLIGPLAALTVASLLFGLVHALTPAYFILASLIGFYLGWLYQATGNLVVPIAVHFLYDWIVLTLHLRGKTKTR